MEHPRQFQGGSPLLPVTDVAHFRLFSTFSLFPLTTLRWFTYVNHITQPWFPTALVLAVVISPHGSMTIPKDEATLSLTHFIQQVGYGWRNIRLHHLKIMCNKYLCHFVSQGAQRNCQSELMQLLAICHKPSINMGSTLGPCSKLIKAKRRLDNLSTIYHIQASIAFCLPIWSEAFILISEKKTPISRKDMP
jgi:hypothetical protein